MITYADVQAIYRLEKNSTSLQKIPDNFYSEVKSLLSQVGEEHHSYLMKLISEIQEKRKNKMLIQAMRDFEAPGNLTSAEKEVYSKITQLLQDYQGKISFPDDRIKEEKQVVEEKKPEGEKTTLEKIATSLEEENKVKVKILKPLPEIIGPDGKNYGPFFQDSEVTLPKEVAKILIERGVAKKI